MVLADVSSFILLFLSCVLCEKKRGSIEGYFKNENFESVVIENIVTFFFFLRD